MPGHGGVAPVPGTAHVGGDALSLMEDLDGAVRDPHPELLASPDTVTADA